MLKSGAQLLRLSARSLQSMAYSARRAPLTLASQQPAFAGQSLMLHASSSTTRPRSRVQQSAFRNVWQQSSCSTHHRAALCCMGRGFPGWNVSTAGQRSHWQGMIPHAMSLSTVPPSSTDQAADDFAAELRTVNVAIVVNLLIFVAKVVVWFTSGSSSMLAEAVHSLADVGNQVLLRTGVLKAIRAPTAQYPYGYMRDKFVWALISAVGIFCCGAGVSFVHGVQGLFQPHELDNLFWNFVVLGFSGVLEGYSLYVAMKTVAAGAQRQGMSLWQYVQAGNDPTSTAVMMEDGGAVAGLAIAGLSTALVKLTGNVVWDAAGSIAVSFLLGWIAIFLIQRNRSMLLGRSMNTTDMNEVLQHLRRDPVVENVIDIKSEEIGPGIFRFKAEIDFDGASITERYLQRNGKDRIYNKLKTAAQSGDQGVFLEIMKDYGEDIVSSIGEEVDRIEQEIQAINPGIKYVDLETDRGRFGIHLRRTMDEGDEGPAQKVAVGDSGWQLESLEKGKDSGK